MTTSDHPNAAHVSTSSGSATLESKREHDEEVFQSGTVLRYVAAVCEYGYSQLVLTPPLDGARGIEQLPMCRMLQSCTHRGLFGEVRRIQLIARMERAGYDARHVDGCGFADPSGCPSFRRGRPER